MILLTLTTACEHNEVHTRIYSRTFITFSFLKVGKNCKHLSSLMVDMPDINNQPRRIDEAGDPAGGVVAWLMLMVDGLLATPPVPRQAGLAVY